MCGTFKSTPFYVFNYFESIDHHELLITMSLGLLDYATCIQFIIYHLLYTGSQASSSHS